MWSFSLLFLCVVPMVLSEEKLLLPTDQILALGPIEPCKIRRNFDLTTTSPSTPMEIQTETIQKDPPSCT
uniref:CUZD1 n=1 Tax=Steinernema glaseri TaxID=37863 RepID=A0A1I8A299_9BILA